MSTPAVSFVMSVFNAEATVRKAISSILNQSYRDFEIIIVDDGSTDRSCLMIKDMSRRDSRIRFIKRDHQGLTQSLIFGIEASRGRLIARMDADDISLPNRLIHQLDFLEKHPDYGCCGGWAIEIDSFGVPFKYWKPAIDHDEIDRRHIGGRSGGMIHPSVIFYRELYDRVGGYSAEFSFAQDYDLWLKMAEKARLANVPEFLLKYRRLASAISQRKTAEQVDCIKSIHQKAIARRGLSQPDSSIFSSRRLSPPDFSLYSRSQHASQHKMKFSVAIYILLRSARRGVNFLESVWRVLLRRS